MAINNFSLIGAGSAVQGALEVARGNVASGLKQAFLGAASAQLGAEMAIGSDYGTAIAKMSLGSCALGFAAYGVSQLVRGVKQSNLAKTVRGAVQVAAGMAGAAAIALFPPAAHATMARAALLAVASGSVACSGVKDIAKKRYVKGTVKTLAGLGGMAWAGFYAYHELTTANPFSLGQPAVECNPYSTMGDRLSSEQQQFLERRQWELTEMYDQQRAVGNWTRVGTGLSKRALEHPEFPGHVLKIPTHPGEGFFTRDDLVTSFCHNREAKQLAQNYPHLAIPQAFLVSIPSGHVLIEEKLPFASHDELVYRMNRSAAYRAGASQAVAQLGQFLNKSGFCDIELYQNALPLTGQEPKVGLFDFDCRNRPFYERFGEANLPFVGQEGIEELRQKIQNRGMCAAINY